MIKTPDIRGLYVPVQPTVRQSGERVTYREFLPDLALQGFIYCYWRLQTTAPLDDPFIYRVVADGCIDIFFELNNHPSQQPLFHKAFQGQGVYLTIEVDDVDKLYNELKKKGVTIEIDLRNEPWGDRHFAISDPNGIGIDLVRYVPQETK